VRIPEQRVGDRIPPIVRPASSVAQRATPMRTAHCRSRSGQFMRHAHPAPPAPHPPEGCGEEEARGAPTPTIPGLERCFARFALWHSGQEAVRWAVTNASN
jgi:hypothetical protein